MEFAVKNFLVNFMSTISDCLGNTYTSVSEDGSSSEYSSDSDNMNIKPRKSTPPKKNLLILIQKVKMKLTVLEKTSQVLQV